MLAMGVHDPRAPSTAQRQCPCGLPAVVPHRPHVDSVPHINDLPDEMLAAVFVYLSCFEATASVPLVCRRWKGINEDRAVPQRACHPCADDPPATKCKLVCAPACPLARARICFRLSRSHCLPSGFGKHERPSPTVFCLYARKQAQSSTASAFPSRCRPLDTRACEESARTHGDAAAVSLLEYGWPSSSRVFAWCVARGSSIERLLALVLAGCPIDAIEVGMACAWSGRTDVLSLLVDLGATHTVDACAWQVAAMRGHIDWMLGAQARGLLRPTQECARAAAWAGHTGVVAWLADACDLDDASIVSGAVAARVDVASLRQLIGSGWAVTPDAVVQAACHGAIDAIAYIESVFDTRPMRACGARPLLACVEAASRGHLDCLAYLRAHGYPWDERVCAAAATNGHLDCLVYARDHGCSWDASTCTRAAAGGHYDCLVYAHENGCPWDATACEAASGGGHLTCLAYAHEAGCAWDERTTAAAAANGHTPCLAYAHERGCPWDVSTVKGGISGGHRDCVAYAHRHGCPCRPHKCRLFCARQRCDADAVCGRPYSAETPAFRRRQKRRIRAVTKGPPPWAVACTSRTRGPEHDPWNRLLASLAERRGVGSLASRAVVAAANMHND